MGLRGSPWTEVLTNTDNRGSAAGGNDMAAGAGHDVTIFLNNDAVLGRAGTGPFVAAFNDPSVGAARPGPNFVSVCLGADRAL